MKFFVDKKGYLNKPEVLDVTKIVLPEDTKVVVGNAFEGFNRLKEIYLNNGLKVIGERAFYQCCNLETIQLPASLTSIEAGAFEECLSLERMAMPESVDYIKEMTFLNCQALKEIKLSNKTTSISDFAFKNCYKLKKVDFPSLIERLGIFAFSNCYSLEKVHLPKLLKEINDYCFYSCIKLKLINVPTKVEIIKENSFGNCSSLEKICLPKSLKIIEKNAFFGCNNIKEIVLKNYVNLVQPGLESCIDDLNYVYINKGTKELIISKSVKNKEDLEKIDYLQIMNYLKCQKEEAIVISTMFSLEELKRKNMWFIAPLLKNIFLDKNYLKIFNDIKQNNKEFLSLYKTLSLETYYVNRLLSDNNIETYSLFKFAYNLGAFSDNPIDRQRACEFISNLFDKKVLDIYTCKDILEKIKVDGFNKEWANFVMDKNNVEVLFNNKKTKQYLSRTYNEFYNIKEFCRSNKGVQKYNQITIDACNLYFSNSLFEGVDNSTEDIANLLSKFTRKQDLFDVAKEIRKEYLALDIKDHLLEEPLFEEIKKEAELIVEGTIDILDSLNKTSNDNFTFEFLAKNDVANFVLGKYCDCCAHLEATGFGIMKASIIHPDCQNLVIRDKNGTIIAKSTLYLNRKEGYGLFNNIEVAENISKKDRILIYNKYIEAVGKFAKRYNEKNKEMPLRQINVGVHSNDLLNELEINTEEAEVLLKGIDFSHYGITGATHEGDWKQGQRVVWKKSNINK